MFRSAFRKHNVIGDRDVKTYMKEQYDEMREIQSELLMAQVNNGEEEDDEHYFYGEDSKGGAPTVNTFK